LQKQRRGYLDCFTRHTLNLFLQIVGREFVGRQGNKKGICVWKIETTFPGQIYCKGLVQNNIYVCASTDEGSVSLEICSNTFLVTVQTWYWFSINEIPSYVLYLLSQLWSILL
jgi:hypothetical protein